MIAATCVRQNIQPGELTIHADRGSSMTSKPVALLMGIGVTKTHSRPHVSNDNPFSESQFKTLKYRPHYPNGLVAKPMPGLGQQNSSAGTTTSIITAPSDCSRLPMFILEERKPFWTNVNKFCMLLI